MKRFLPACLVAAALAAVPFACVVDDGAGSTAAGGASAGSSTATASSSTGGIHCKGIVVQNDCGQCLEDQCCTELAACDDDATCRDCLEPAADPGTCTDNPQRKALVTCEGSQCADACIVDFGNPCETDVDCTSGHCLPGKVCSKPCVDDTDCPAGDQWGCQPGDGLGYCTCTPSGSELCDGADNDCDGKIDDGASCDSGEVCSNGACMCPGETCDGACVNLSSDHDHCGACDVACGATEACCDAQCIDDQNDAFNCGSCGHDCLGSACTAGVCDPTQLNGAGDIVDGVAMAVDNLYVFVADTTALWRVATFGGSAQQLAIYGTEMMPATPKNVALNLDYAYLTFANPGELMLVPKDGGFIEEIASGSSLQGVAVDLDNVYFTDRAAGTVNAVSVFGGVPEELASEGPQKAQALGLYGTRVYYSTGTAVKRVGTTGGSVTTLVTQPAGDVAVDGSNVYFTTTTGVARVSVNGGSAALVAPDPYAQKVVVDNEHAYWISLSEIRRVSKKGGPIETIATMQTALAAIAIDSQYVYWLDGTNGIVWKAPK